MSQVMIETVPDRLSGEPVFTGTRIYADDYIGLCIAGGEKWFRECFPDVTDEQIAYMRDLAIKTMHHKVREVCESQHMQEQEREAPAIGG